MILATKHTCYKLIRHLLARCNRFLLLGMMLLVVSCDGSDCIDPADFGNLVIKNFVIDSNPYDGDDFKENPGTGISYDSYYKSCSGTGGSNISESSKGYYWLDTGIDIVSDRHKLSIKVLGAANFCAPQISATENDDGTPVPSETVNDCGTAQTLFFAHMLTGEEEALYSADGDAARYYQPVEDKPECSASTPTANSTYYVDDHNNFVIMIPRVKESPYASDDEIDDEVDNLISSLSSEIDDIGDQRDILEAQIRRANSHSLKGEYDTIDYKRDEKKVLNAVTESSRDSWYSRGKNIRVAIFDDDGDKEEDLGLLTGSNFIHNPALPSDVRDGDKRKCCMKVVDNECVREDTESDRGYYVIDTDAEGSDKYDAELYNYCKKDVFRYDGDKTTGYVKFKIDEDWEEYEHCDEGSMRSSPRCYCRCTGSKGGKWGWGGTGSTSYQNSIGDCGSPSEGGPWAEGCWERSVNTVVPADYCFGIELISCSVEFGIVEQFEWKGEPDVHSSYHDNYGVYSVITKSSKSCIGKYETLQFRIGADKAANRKILSSNKFFEVPWNTGRLYVRVIDPKVLERDEFNVDKRECHWTKGGRDVSDLKKLYDNNVGKFTINIRTVETDEAITHLKDTLFEKFDYVLNEGFQEKFYNNLIGTDKYQNLLTILMLLYVTFTGIGFVMGITNINQHDLLMRIIKIGLIYTLLLPGSWEFFSYLIIFFEHGAEELGIMLAGSFIGEDDENTVGHIYSLLDELVYVFFQPEIHQKISAVFFSPILVGIVLFFFIYYAIFLMLYAVAKSIIIYLVIKIIFAILFMVAPIFIVFSLFERTKQVFEQWLNMVISYSVQLIFLFLCIAFFSYLILNVFYDIFYYGICWKPVWIIKIGSLPEFELFSFWRYHGFDSRYSEAYNVSKGPDFTSVLFFLAIAYCFKQMIDKVTDLGNSISGYGGVGAGSLASNMMKDAAGAVGDIAKYASKNIGKPVLGTALNATWQLSKPVRMAIGAPGSLADYVSSAGTKGLLNASEKGSKAWDAYNKASGGDAPQGKSMMDSLRDWNKASFGNKMLRMKDAISSAGSKFAESNREFLDFSGKTKRAIGGGSLLHDNEVMNSYDKSIKAGLSDAKARGLSGQAAKDHATKRAENILNRLDLPKNQLEKLKRSAAKEIGEAQASTITSGSSRTGWMLNRIGALDTAEGLINQRKKDLKDSLKKDEELKKEIGKVKLAMQGLGEKDIDTKRQLAAQMRLHSSELNNEVNDMITARAEIRSLTRDQVLASAERIKALDLEGEALAKEKQKEVDQLKAMYDDEDLSRELKVQFDTELQKAMDDQEEYLKSVQKSLDDDKKMLEDHYKEVTGEEFVSKLSAEEAREMEAGQEVDNVQLSKEEDKKTKEQDKQETEEDKLAKAEKARKSRDARSKILSLKGELKAKENELRNATGADKDKIKADMQSLEQRIREAESYSME